MIKELINFRKTGIKTTSIGFVLPICMAAASILASTPLYAEADYPSVE